MKKECSDERCYCVLTHDVWQRQVSDLAVQLGWSYLHVRKSIGKNKQWQTTTNRDGWSDLFLWHPRHGFAAIECKTANDGRNPADKERRRKQREVLAELAAAGAVTLMAWPHHFDDVVAILRPRNLASGR